MGGRTVVSDDEEEMEEEERENNVADRRGDDDEDEDEEEEEGQDEYEKDGFIVDDEEEEEEEEEKEESDGEQHKKKRKKKRESERNYVLDEDDYALLEDNNIVVQRPKPGNKFKRLKKARRDMEAETGFSDEEEADGSSLRGRTAEEKLKRSLFGDDEGAPFEDIAEEEEQPEEEEEPDMIGEEDEMADFIVDEEDVDETGAVVRKKNLKKKKSRQTPGVSSSALQEAHEIFGDVDELLMRRKQDRGVGDSAGWVEKRIEDEFEPLILSEKYMTAEDDRIRETDIPERIQVSEDITGPPPTDDRSIAEESTWIHNQLAEGVNPKLFGISKEAISKEDIGNVLTMLHVQKLDIPFIAMYRKELCSSLLNDPEADAVESEEARPKMKWHKILWAVQALDKKWLLLQKRKSSLQVYYTKRFEEEARRLDDEIRLSLNKKLFESIIEALNEAKSEREVDDVDSKFNLHFPPGEVDLEEGQFKRPKRRSLYSTCYKAGLWEVASKFGCSSEQFGKHLLYAEVNPIEDCAETPEEVAENFTCTMFESPQDVLKGARHMAAVEIGCEPSARKHVRDCFIESAIVSTRPTPEGNTIIDAYHELASVKWLRDKPVDMFESAQWLLIQKGEEEKLLQVTVKLSEEAKKKLLHVANEYYLSDRVSRPAKLWNEQRKLILEEAFNNYLFPAMEKEIRSLLTARAKSWLLMEYGKELWKRASVAPYKPKGSENDSEDEYESRVMACCWGPGKPATTFVMLDFSGEMVDVLYAGSISIRSQGVAEQQRKKNDQQRVLKFITDHQPHAICVGAANLSCRLLKDDIFEVIFKIVEDHPTDVSQDMENINIMYGDESLPHLYENSRVSSDQLPGQSGIVRRAVALGRYLQNPLAMMATLCGPGKEILSWKLCPLEHFLSPDEKYEMVEQVMVDATNQVGLDINLAASHEWLFAPLQFISGLGPRKASALQRAFVRAGSIFNRKEIPMKVLRKKVFINAVGFLRVRRSGALTSSGHIMDLLDDTRIHPESYDLAKNLAKDVFVYDTSVNEVDDDTEEMAIEHVRERPDILKALKFDKYVKDMNERLKTDKRATLYDIKMELLHGFQDWRTPFREPNPDEEFALLSGETEDTLSEGRIVQVTVRNVQESRILCAFDSGLKGVIMAEDYSDDGFEPNVKEGDIITCKIKNVNKNRLLVYLTSKGSDLRKRPRNIRYLDKYYQEDDLSLRSEQEKTKKEKELAKRHFKPRMIVHPRFQNLTAKEAMDYLLDKEPGESIIRPSSKGPSFLTLTIKIYDEVYAHKDIVEGGKDHKDITSLLRLGKSLKIDNDTFEDLDEVMDRYVDPLVAHLKNMLSYRKFRKGTKGEVDDQLRAEKAENPMRIVYCFGISHEHPGTFILSYIRSTNPHHEYIGLYPKGFRFRKKDFEDIDRLVAFFQRNIDKPPDGGPSLRTVAAMVPMRPAGGGGYSDSGTGGSWGAGGRSNDWGKDLENDRSGSRTGGRYGGRGRGRGRGNNFSGNRQDSDYGSNDRDSGGWGDNNGDSGNDGGSGGGWSHGHGGARGGRGGRGGRWGDRGGGGDDARGTGGWSEGDKYKGGEWGGSARGEENRRNSGWGNVADGDRANVGSDNAFGASNSDWGGSKKLVSSQAGGGSGWSSGGGGGW